LTLTIYPEIRHSDSAWLPTSNTLYGFG